MVWNAHHLSPCATSPLGPRVQRTLDLGLLGPEAANSVEVACGHGESKQHGHLDLTQRAENSGGEVGTLISKEGGSIHERSGFIELLDHGNWEPHILLEVKRRCAHAEQCSDRLSGVLVHIPKLTGLCREIEFRDLNNPQAGFPLDESLYVFRCFIAPTILSRDTGPNGLRCCAASRQQSSDDAGRLPGRSGWG